MKILVTGANGLVGHALMSQPLIGHELIPVFRTQFDLLQWRHVKEIFDVHRPDAVIHLAAKVGGVKANMAAPATFFMENITINTHILEAARLCGVKKLVCFLSTCIFPDGLEVPLTPQHLHAGPPHHSNYGYAYAKRMLAVQCQSYNEQYGTNFVPVIPCNIYGPHDNFDLENGHVVPAMIRKFWEAKIAGQDVTLWGDGGPLREFIFSDDVARLCLRVLTDYSSTEPLVLSPGLETSVANLASVVAASMNFQGRTVYDTSKPSGQYRKPSNNGPLMELWPNFEFTNLVYGINKTVDWFKSVYPKVRGV